MADKNTYTTIKQHEPLRVPEGWSPKEKKLIAQLEEIFDDIYARFGRLKMSDLGTGLQKTLSSKATEEYVDGVAGTLWEQTAEAISSKADKQTVDGQFQTLQEQTAEKLSQKADKQTVDGQFQTLQEQTAEKLSQKASSQELLDLEKRVKTNETQIEITAKGVNAIVTGETPAGAVETTAVEVKKNGVHLKTGGTFTVDSSNFTVDEEGNVVVNNATVRGELWNNGQRVLTPLDIYVGTVAPLNPTAGMVWIRPGRTDTPEESPVRTTHAWNYTQGIHTPLREPISGYLHGSGAAPVDKGNGFIYEIAIPLFIAGTVNNAILTIDIGGLSFSATVSGIRFNEPTVYITGESSLWVADTDHIPFTLSASNGLVQTPNSYTPQITVVSRTA